MKTLAEIVDELKDAGSFGDGISTGVDHPIEILSSSRLSEEERLAASLSLLCRLAAAVDTSTWQVATHAALARRTRDYLDLGGAVAPDCAAAVLDFYRSEEGFWAALDDVYRNVVSKRGEDGLVVPQERN